MSLEKSGSDYRFERKFFITGTICQSIESILKLNTAMFSEIFSERFVNNIYFDSEDLKNYYANIYGDMDRKKFRIRWYGSLFDFVNKPVLELKIKSGLLGTKKRYPLVSFKMDQGFDARKIFSASIDYDIPDNIKLELKFLEPVLLNSYRRKYFLSADKKYRITLDTHQTFYKIGIQNNCFLVKTYDYNNTILELKYDQNCDDHANVISNSLPFRLTKSSKYVTGINCLYL